MSTRRRSVFSFPSVLAVLLLDLLILDGLVTWVLQGRLEVLALAADVGEGLGRLALRGGDVGPNNTRTLLEPNNYKATASSSGRPGLFQTRTVPGRLRSHSFSA